MNPDKKKHHFELLERVKPSESSDRKRMGEFIKKMKMNAENSQLTSKNS